MQLPTSHAHSILIPRQRNTDNLLQACNLRSLFPILLDIIQFRFLNLQAGGHRFDPGHVHQFPEGGRFFILRFSIRGEFLLAKGAILFAIVGWLVSVGLHVQASGLPTGSQCETKGTRELTISCKYSVAAATQQESATPRIALNRAVISFEPWDESHMHVELTFTNDSDKMISEKRTIYQHSTTRRAITTCAGPCHMWISRSLSPASL